MESEPLTWQSVLFRLAAVLVLIFINGFFVAAEFALVGARQSRLKEKAKQGNRLAAIANRLIGNLDQAIAATQLGITVASLLVGWIGESTLSEVFLTVFHFLPGRWASVASHSLAAGLAFGFITFLHVVLGELIPKSVGIVYPTRTMLFVSEPMRIAMILFKPFVWVLNGSGNLMLKMIGMQPARAHQMVHTVEELKILIDASHQGGTLDDAEKELLQKVFKFGDLIARQVMVPRTEMSCMRIDTPLLEVIEIAGRTGHTRFPIYEKDMDNIAGILHMKDVVFQSQTNAPFHLSKIMKEAHFVPEAMPIVQLLTHLKQKHTQMVIVVDEFGGTSGLVTLEDVIEEIIGDFYDEHHPAMSEVVRVSEHEVVLQARVRLDEINEQFKLNLHSEEADTLGGFVLQELGQIPRVGDRLELPGVTIRVEEMSRWKIKTLRMTLQPQPVQQE